ncbi:PstS family phosphate ABC transporter substrate-binding protein [Vibrio sp. HB236076]|uniref:Phosphate-binding protein n=1 Tax=Vibrio sp. HB236076 TaxID=3232307 RepID=A0AB39HEE1_9VIBR
MIKQKATLLAVTACLSFSLSAQAAELEPYQRQSGVFGELLSVGSDTLAGLTSAWLRAFQGYYPNIDAQVQASGSSTAPPALIEQTAQLGPMSRPMRQKEIQAFVREHGYPPTELKIAIDAIGIFVNQDNLLKGLSFAQVDALFSSTLRCKGVMPIERWAQLGVKGEWGLRNIQRFGRNSASGTYGYFKEHALCGGDFRLDVNEQPGSASVVQSVASTIDGIGYSGVGYRVSGVRFLPISQDGIHYVSPTRDNIINERYPLSRYLYLYINKAPNKPLSPIMAQFIRYVYSIEGQAVVSKEGYVPISVKLAEQELNKVGL